MKTGKALVTTFVLILISYFAFADSNSKSDVNYYYRLFDGTPVVFSVFAERGESSLSVTEGHVGIQVLEIQNDNEYQFAVLGEYMTFAVPFNLKKEAKWRFHDFKFKVMDQVAFQSDGAEEFYWRIESQGSREWEKGTFLWSDYYGLISYTLPRAEKQYLIESGEFGMVVSGQVHWLEKFPGLGAIRR